LIWSPSKIGLPSPYGVMYAATVARLIVVTTAIRIPAEIAGSASGSSTRRRICDRVSPIPRAASSTSGGTLRSPASVLRKRIRSV
jgi:hypothetical protein